MTQKKQEFTHMIVEKITGIALSRHTSESRAEGVWRLMHTDIKPLEIRKYSKPYWREMH
jgi:hypothetical protein